MHASIFCNGWRTKLQVQPPQKNEHNKLQGVLQLLKEAKKKMDCQAPKLP